MIAQFYLQVYQNMRLVQNRLTLFCLFTQSTNELSGIKSEWLNMIVTEKK